jgi:lipopolysaccharide biosynthesis glycosyltransferase
MESIDKKQKKIVPSVLFDRNYIEPGLLTAYQLLCNADNCFEKLRLIYLQSETENLSEVEDLFRRFLDLANRTGNISVEFSVLKNNLTQINSYHFNNSVIYKTLLPFFFDNDSFLLNIDAGFLIGSRFREYFIKLEDLISINQDWIVAARCGNIEKELNDRLRELPHTSKYPFGGILLFNVGNYRAALLKDRLISNLTKLEKHLTWPEQDLLCCTLNDEELAEIEENGLTVLKELSIKNFYYDDVDVVDINDYALYKIIGTLKPWKYWVLDNNKSHYLLRRNELEMNLRIDHPIIHENRHSVTNILLQQKFLEAFEVKLTLPPSETH